MCSAALLLDWLEGRGAENWTPPLGSFYLESQDLEMLSAYDNVVVCDMALPEGDIQALAKHSHVVILDHHHQEPIAEAVHVNPVAHGSPANQWPSTTWVVRDHLGLETGFKVLMGMVGDREEKILDHPRFRRLVEAYREDGLEGFKGLLSLARRVDACYKTGEREAVMEAARLLQGYQTGLEVLANSRWEQLEARLEEKLAQVLSEPPDMRDGVQVKRLDTQFLIISHVTRALAWDSGRDTVVINTGLFQDRDQFYCRSEKKDLRPLIQLAKRRGFNAGGKKEVLGAIIPKGETEGFLEEAIRFLSG